ncbi:hypothetical protein [Shimia thalassica]|uniref:hypothetical protein n=1 Tax=Shimia thalassica TaxID=1715693 RepID=UPI002735D846|nr:hypothetical protein [Shimia thalassica]MDP2519248.1 hypothetical protein [Shimia thalassica]
MTNQLNAAFEVIAVDGSLAYFLDNTVEDDNGTFEEFEAHSGLSLMDLDLADKTKTTVFVPADDRHYTVGRILSEAERKADRKL